MKVLIFSDSHGNVSPMLVAIDRESPNMILHCGDNAKDCDAVAAVYPNIPLRIVSGNCDTFSKEEREDEFIISGKRIYMTHGHLHNVKMGLKSIVNDALLREVDLLIFGHTHIAHHDTSDDLTIINPGSIGYPEHTYAALEIKDGIMTCTIKKVL
ncbi:MAG: YfcE family phosphodiesterase [Oscillospiraceae bacterium]|nr:YfcE family phosphodiesterase [Oscillospiraceae bacterium]